MLRYTIKKPTIPFQLMYGCQVRLQTTAAAAEVNVAAQSEWDQARSFKKIPTISAWQMFRNNLPGGKYYKKDSNQFLASIQRDYGDIFLMPGLFGNSGILLSYNPNDFERVFRVDGIWPHRPGLDTLNHHRSEHRADFYQGVEGILATHGEKWGKFRSAVNPVLLQPKNVRLYLQKMSQVNLEFVERIKQIRNPKSLEVPENFEEEINYWTLESASVVALDKQLGLLQDGRDKSKAKQLFEDLNVFFTLSLEIDHQPSLWKNLHRKKFNRIMKAFDDIQDTTSGYINETIERLELESKNGVEKAEKDKSVLEKLLQMDKRIAIVMAMEMFIAGVDTTATAFTGLMLCLATNPEKQAKLREEIFRILPHKNSEFTESAMQNIPYLRACIKEALRIYPLTVGNARVSQKDVVLSGYRVPKGTKVSMVSAALLQDEQYFPRATEFLPERWLRESKDLRTSSPFISLPFGFGSRSCIGRRIAEMELELGVARILRNFNVEFNYPTDNAFKTLVINVPNIPLKFKFTDIE